MARDRDRSGTTEQLPEHRRHSAALRLRRVSGARFDTHCHYPPLVIRPAGSGPLLAASGWSP